MCPSRPHGWHQHGRLGEWGRAFLVFFFSFSSLLIFKSSASARVGMNMLMMATSMKIYDKPINRSGSKRDGHVKQFLVLIESWNFPKHKTHEPASGQEDRAYADWLACQWRAHFMWWSLLLLRGTEDCPGEKDGPLVQQLMNTIFLSPPPPTLLLGYRRRLAWPVARFHLISVVGKRVLWRATDWFSTCSMLMFPLHSFIRPFRLPLMWQPTSSLEAPVSSSLAKVIQTS